MQYRTELGMNMLTAAVTLAVRQSVIICRTQNKDMGKLSWKIVGTSMQILWKLQVCRVANSCHYKVDVKDNWNSE